MAYAVWGAICEACPLTATTITTPDSARFPAAENLLNPRNQGSSINLSIGIPFRLTRLTLETSFLLFGLGRVVLTGMSRGSTRPVFALISDITQQKRAYEKPS